MNRFILTLLPLLFISSVRAEVLGHAVEINPSAGWQSVEPTEPGKRAAPLPTLKFVPRDGRRVALLVTLMPARAGNFAIRDLASLKKFNLVSATPYLPTPDAKPVATEFKLAEGLGVYVVNEDPSLVGKPTPPNEYRIATTASVLLGNRFVLHCTILHEKADSEDFRQALQILASAHLASQDNDAVSRPGFSAVLHLPPKRFQPSDMALNRDPGYFIFSNEQGVMLSGWLDRADKFKGMPSFWAKEKANLMSSGALAVRNESAKIVNGWSVIFYSVEVAGVLQKNARACRVAGDTWLDLHLSKTGDGATAKELEDLLSELTVSTH